MPTPPTEMLQGTLDVLILKTLSWGPRHGYAIAKWLEETTDDTLQIEEGSLYPALQRMLRSGWLEARWETSASGRRVRVYAITPSGVTRLEQDPRVEFEPRQLPVEVGKRGLGSGDAARARARRERRGSGGSAGFDGGHRRRSGSS